MGFHDFEEYERLLTIAQRRDPNAYVAILLGGDAGLRLGELVALEWRDVDLHARRLTVQRSDWRGHVTVPKGGRSRRLPMTLRLTNALKANRHLRSERVVSAARRTDHTRPGHQGHPRGATRRGIVAQGRARAATHPLFAPGHEGWTSSRNSGAGRPRGSVHDAALQALESGCNRRRDVVVGHASGR